MTCFSGHANADALYVILPYFNFCQFKRRRTLFTEFIERIRGVPGIRIVVSEALFPGNRGLPRFSGVFQHLRFRTDDHVWLKENLINLAVSKLPDEWKYVAWIDADLTFLNTHWVRDTIEELQVYDVVQMFHTCVNLGPCDEAIKIDRSFGYMHAKSGTPYTKTDRYGFWHPGYAWACTRQQWNKMHGLVDWAILGSGDRHMALAWIGKVDLSYPGDVHSNYVSMLKEYQVKCEGTKLGYVHGTIMHHWHGRFEDRKYRERWIILTKGKFDPLEDLFTNKQGLIQLSKPGKRFELDLKDYFVGRQED
jgi:hypothetical protein